MSEPLPNFLNIEIPSDVPTTFADVANLWHTPDVFVIDFLSMVAPPQPGADPAGTDSLIIPLRVAHRVKIAPAQVFELMKALEKQLSAYELEKGQKPGGNAPD